MIGITAPLAASGLQPEAIALFVVLGIAVLALAVSAYALVDTRRRRRERAAALEADRPDVDRFRGQHPPTVIAAADRSLATGDDRALVAAALWLHRHEDRQAVPYLLHAARCAPAHQVAPVLEALAAEGHAALGQHPLLTAALPDDRLRRLQDRLQEAARPTDGARSSGPPGRPADHVG